MLWLHKAGASGFWSQTLRSNWLHEPTGCSGFMKPPDTPDLWSRSVWQPERLASKLDLQVTYDCIAFFVANHLCAIPPTHPPQWPRFPLALKLLQRYIFLKHALVFAVERIHQISGPDILQKGTFLSRTEFSDGTFSSHFFLKNYLFWGKFT